MDRRRKTEGLQAERQTGREGERERQTDVETGRAI